MRRQQFLTPNEREVGCRTSHQYGARGTGMPEGLSRMRPGPIPSRGELSSCRGMTFTLAERPMAQRRAATRFPDNETALAAGPILHARVGVAAAGSARDYERCRWPSHAQQRLGAQDARGGDHERQVPDRRLAGLWTVPVSQHVLRE